MSSSAFPPSPHLLAQAIANEATFLNHLTRGLSRIRTILAVEDVNPAAALRTEAADLRERLLSGSWRDDDPDVCKQILAGVLRAEIHWCESIARRLEDAHGATGTVSAADVLLHRVQQATLAIQASTVASQDALSTD